MSDIYTAGLVLKQRVRSFYSEHRVEEDHRDLSQPVYNSTLISMYVLQEDNGVATNRANEAELFRAKFISKDFHYGVSNVSHCPAVDDGVDGGIKENEGNREHAQHLQSYACI